LDVEEVRVHLAQTERAFTEFVKDVEPKLHHALVMAYGPEVGSEATADALMYGWENWGKVEAMDNPAGYLFRVGQSRARHYRRRRLVLPPVSQAEMPHVEPGLPRALERLSRRQRIAVVLVHAHGYSDSEVAALLRVSRRTVRNHVERGLRRLRMALHAEEGME
jgi:RNA polymerase sigma-70 factor (ECF subfamily)